MRKYFAINPILATGAVLLAGCASLSTNEAEVLERLKETAPQEHVLSIPFIPQESADGAAESVAMVLQFYGVYQTPQRLSPLFQEEKTEDAVVSAAAQQQFLTLPLSRFDALLAYVAAGQPVLIREDEGWLFFRKRYYGVLKGYDLNRDQVVLHRGTLPDVRRPRADFLRAWQRAGRWAWVLLPAGGAGPQAEELSVSFSAP